MIGRLAINDKAQRIRRFGIGLAVVAALYIVAVIAFIIVY